MTGDYQVRFCERIRVKLPLPTRPQIVSYNQKKIEIKEHLHLIPRIGIFV